MLNCIYGHVFTGDILLEMKFEALEAGSSDNTNDYKLVIGMFGFLLLRVCM